MLEARAGLPGVRTRACVGVVCLPVAAASGLILGEQPRPTFPESALLVSKNRVEKALDVLYALMTTSDSDCEAGRLRSVSSAATRGKQ